MKGGNETKKTVFRAHRVKAPTMTHIIQSEITGGKEKTSLFY